MSEKNKLFQITERDISNYTDASSLSRGKNYFQNDMIYDAYLIDDVLQSKCSGSMGMDYNVQIKFSTNGIVNYQCSCPRGGFCKHIIALLLVYIKDFEAIQVVDANNLNKIFRDKSKNELMEIIINLLKQNPEIINSLEILNNMNTSKKIKDRNLEELITKYKKLADNCFRGYYDKPYYAAYGAGEKLNQFMSQADKLKEKEMITAIAIFTAIFESIENNMEMVDDSDGVIGGVAHDCIHELIEIISESSFEPDTRQKWQKTIFNHFAHNNYGIGDELDVLLLKSCKNEDIDFLKHLVNRELSVLHKKDNYHNDFIKRELCVFLANLYGKEGKNEKVLELYKEQQLHFEYVMKLLNLEQIENAYDYAKNYLAKGYDVFRFAETLIENKFIDKALNYILWAIDNLDKNEPYYKSLFEKLALVYEIKKDWNSACKVNYDIFKSNPDFDRFKTLKKSAERINEWEQIKNEAIEYLKNNKKYSVLIEIYLWQSEIELAIDFFNEYKKENIYFSYGEGSIAFKLAKSAEKLYPEISINIYKEESEKLISRGDRSNYREAVKHLRKIKNLSKADDFNNYVSNLMLIHKRRIAFLDEIKKIL